MIKLQKKEELKRVTYNDCRNLLWNLLFPWWKSKLCQETRRTSVLFLMCSVGTARQDQESYYPMRNHRPTWVMLPSRAIAVFTFVLMWARRIYQRYCLLAQHILSPWAYQIWLGSWPGKQYIRVPSLFHSEMLPYLHHFLSRLIPFSLVSRSQSFPLSFSFAPSFIDFHTASWLLSWARKKKQQYQILPL